MTLPLWHSLTQAQKLPYNKRFATLTPQALRNLSLPHLGVLVQWLLGHDMIVTKQAVERAGGIDLDLDNQALTQVECARVFADKTPATAIYDAFEHIQGKGAKRIYIFSLGDFSERDRQTQADNKSFLELIDGREWATRLKIIQAKDARFFAERKKKKG
jgi:hypothetical protein